MVKSGTAILLRGAIIGRGMSDSRKKGSFKGGSPGAQYNLLKLRYDICHMIWTRPGIVVSFCPFSATGQMIQFSYSHGVLPHGKKSPLIFRIRNPSE